MRNRPLRGFSLVELSIVLVILGLLTGGILAGQSLIRASELRNITREYQYYTTAIHSFRDKYMAVPGDITNASSFWGLMTNCGAASPSGTGTQTCNGNGDGRIGQPTQGARTGEMFTFWQQLANAGLIEGSYTGIAGATNLDEAVLGVNTPASKFPNTGWSMHYNNLGGTATRYALNYGNAFAFGAVAAASYTRLGVLSVQDTWGIDTKLDDGKPGTGRIIVINWNSCTTSTTNTDYAGQFNLDNTTATCAFYGKEIF